MAQPALFNIPMYFEGKHVIQTRPSVDTLSKTARSPVTPITPLFSASPRDSVSTKSCKSSRTTNSNKSQLDPPKQPSSSFQSHSTKELIVDLTPMGTEELAMLVANYGYRGSDPLSMPYGFENVTWDSETIDETVTPKFLREKIHYRPLRERLDVPMAFGDGLTDTTYAEWVVERAKRFFLLLLEFGVPEKIFDIVDQSWDDDDLPVQRESIHKLKLREIADKSLENKFYKRQFAYLLKDLPRGSHVEYEDDDSIPLDFAGRMKGNGASYPGDDKVTRPRRRNLPIYRRKVTLGDSPGTITDGEFLAEIDLLKDISHAHIVELESSYTYQGEGYILSTPACDMSLRQFIQSPSNSFKALNREQRRRKLLGWIHCLSDALAYLHDQNLQNFDIRPRSILVHNDNLYLSDVAIMKNLDPTSRKIDNLEAERYEYDAPEHWIRALHSTNIVPSTPITARSHFKFLSNAPTVVASTSDDTSSVHSGKSNSSLNRTISNSISNPSLTTIKVGEWVSNVSAPLKASTFSLACIFLDILSFNAKKKPSAFVSHRSAKKGSSRGGGKPDTSFHANLPQVESWMDLLEKDARKNKDGEDRAVQNILDVCRKMMAKESERRPAQRDVADELWKILRGEGGMPHCGCASRSPNRDEMEEAAILGRMDDAWEWPWDDKRSTRNRPLTGFLGEPVC